MYFVHFSRNRCIMLLSITLLLVFTFPCAVCQLSSKELNDTQKGQLENFASLVEKYQNEGNKVQQANYLNKIAYLYWENESGKEAVDYFLQSVQLNKEVGNKNAMQALYGHIALIYTEAEDYPNALEYFKKSLQINRQLNKKREITSNLINIGSIYFELKDYHKSNENLKEALVLSQELNDINLLRTCYGMLAENFQSLGNSEKYFEYSQLYATLTRQIQEEKEEEQQQKLSATEARALQAEKEKTRKEEELKQAVDTLEEVKELADERQLAIENLKQKERLRELKTQQAKIRQRTITFSLIGAVFFMAIILFIIYKNFQNKKKVNALLEKQNREILDQQSIIETTNRNLTNSINYAKRIQEAMLPPVDDFKRYLPESFILFKPRDIVSGDFYWFSETRLHSVISRSKSSVMNKIIYSTTPKIPDDNSIIVAAVDCTGHGVPGAFMSMIGYNLMHEIISKGIIEPNKILAVLNTGIRNQLKQDETDNRDGMDMALCVINKKKNILEFSGAKNPLVYIQDGDLQQIRGDYMPIGGFQKEDYEKRKYEKHTISIDKPTCCYIFSDGFSDQIGGPEGRKYLTKRFREFLFSIHANPMEKQKELLEAELDNWIGTNFNQVDDILIMGFKLTPNQT